ncbi:MAG: pilus assembly protein TadG-related protein [Planctomycetota bacterium]
MSRKPENRRCHCVKETGKNIAFGKAGRAKGIALVWVAIMLLPLILFLGLTIDGAMVYLAAHQLQNAADAAVLAGARIVRISEPNARGEAQLFAGLNLALKAPVFLDLNPGNNPDGDIVVGKYDFDTQTFTPTQDHPDALKAVARRIDDGLHTPVPLFFMPVVNINTADVSRTAIAVAIGGWGAGIISLSCDGEPPSGIGLDISSGGVDVQGGGIQVNSTSDWGFRVSGNRDITAEEIHVSGGTKGLPNDLLDITFTGAPYQPDPLCPGDCAGNVTGDCLPAPPLGPLQDPNKVKIAPGETRTLSPGYYPGGIEITPSTGTAILESGIYVLNGVGLNINGGNLIADPPGGVMFYIIGTGSVNLQGNGNVQIDELESGPWAGMAIFQDRNNHNDAKIIGTNALDINGTIYFPRNFVEIGGTGDGFGTQLIADTLWIHGDGVLQINYDGRNPFPANKAVIVY